MGSIHELRPVGDEESAWGLMKDVYSQIDEAYKGMTGMSYKRLLIGGTVITLINAAVGVLAIRGAVSLLPRKTR